MRHKKHIDIGSLVLVLYLLWINLEELKPLMTLKGGTSGACAACKYQRRRCAVDCPLSPYFPAENPKMFHNVHRLFGVKSIIKILKKLDEHEKPEAMKSIIFQSYVRDISPVHGCLGVAQNLQQMIWQTQEELKNVCAQLQLYRSQNQNQSQSQMMIHEIGDNKQQHEDTTTTSHVDLGMGLNLNNNQNNLLAPPFFSALPDSQPPLMSYTYSNEVNNNGNNGKEILTHTENDWSGLYNNNNNNGGGGGFSNLNESYNEMKSNNGVMSIQSQLVNLKMVSNNQKEEEDSHGYDDIHQFLETIDDRQSFSDSKEPYASSSGEILKEQIIDIGANELRSAATCFSLTSVN